MFSCEILNLFSAKGFNCLLAKSCFLIGQLILEGNSNGRVSLILHYSSYTAFLYQILSTCSIYIVSLATSKCLESLQEVFTVQGIPRVHQFLVGPQPRHHFPVGAVEMTMWCGSSSRSWILCKKTTRLFYKDSMRTKQEWGNWMNIFSQELQKQSPPERGHCKNLCARENDTVGFPYLSR